MKTNLKILRKIKKDLARKRLLTQIDKKIDEAINEGNFDKILECDFLRRRIQE